MSNQPTQEKSLSETSGDSVALAKASSRNTDSVPADTANVSTDNPHSPRPSVNPIRSAFRIASDESSIFGVRRPTAEWARDVAAAPPPLPYSLKEHKFTISLFWFLIAAESCFIPISFYYGLTFGTNLRHGARKISRVLTFHRHWLIRICLLVFAIITSVFGFVTGFEYVWRGWKLIKKTPEYRPLNAPSRWGFDTVQWTLSLPYFCMTVILIAGSIPTEPLVRVLAMPLPIGLILLGIWLYASAVMYQFKLKTPIRLSSTPKGVVAPPLVYHIIEDVVAVDGDGKRQYRKALHARFEASPRFRRLLWHLTIFWGMPTAFVGAVLLALIFTVKKEVAYGLGWGVPAAWAALWTVITFIWVITELKLEAQNWAVEGGASRFGRSLSLPASGWDQDPEDALKNSWRAKVRGLNKFKNRGDSGST